MSGKAEGLRWFVGKERGSVMGKKVKEVEGLLETHCKAKNLEGLMARVGDVRKGSL